MRGELSSPIHRSHATGGVCSRTAHIVVCAIIKQANRFFDLKVLEVATSTLDLLQVRPARLHAFRVGQKMSKTVAKRLVEVAPTTQIDDLVEGAHSSQENNPGYLPLPA
jgi:hypothetical protein